MRYYYYDNMVITKSNYKLPKREKKEIDAKMKKKLERREYEEKSIKIRGAQGSFVVFKEEGLEDVFVADEL
mgnify:FL=1